MKKFIYFISLLAFVLFFSFGVKDSLAQNIGSLKEVVPSGFSFTLDLLPGYTDYQVMQLQKVLNADVDTSVALEGDGSRGHESKYFGDKTKQAVIKFQEKYRDTILVPAGLTKGTGNVGKSTRTKLNLLIGVMNTSESVGSPESRGSNGPSVTTPVTYVPPVTNQQSTMSSCQLVELLIGINAILPSLSDQARVAIGCPTSNNDHTPEVNLYINGQGGTVSISGPQSINLSWDSKNVTSCRSDNGTGPLSGSQNVQVTVSQSFEITCTGPYGTASDSVSVKIATTTPTNTIDFTLSCRPSNPTSLINSAVNWTSVVTGASNYTYSWSGSDGLVSTTNSASKSYSTTGTKTATVRVTAGSLTKTANCSVSVISSNDYNSLYSTMNTNKVLKTNGGSGDMISIKESNSLKLSQKMTLEAWVNPSSWVSTVDPTSKTKDNVIISKGDLSGETLEYALSLDNGKLVFTNRDSGIWTCQSVIPLNTWTHVAVSIDEISRVTNLYVNGVQVTNICQGARGLFNKSLTFNKAKAITEYTGSTASSTSVKNLHIANFYSPACDTEPSTNGFIGKIDDVRIWNLSRTTDEIAKNATSSVATTTGLVAEYRFDDYSAKDSSSLANDGYQKGAVQFVEDKTAKSFVGTYSAPSYTNFTYTSASFTDPDGFCQSKTEEILPPEEGAGPERFFSFGGIVTAVQTCASRSNMKLWQVRVQACREGEPLSTQDMTGISSNEPGYIVIRDGYQKVPAVGDTVLGKAVDDHGLECSNGEGKYIGTVTGHLSSESGHSSECTAAESGNNSNLKNCISSRNSSLTCEDKIGQHWVISSDGSIEAIGADYGIIPMHSGFTDWKAFYDAGGSGSN